MSLCELKNLFWKVRDHNQRKKAVLWIRIGFNADPDPNPDPAFISMRIRIAKPMVIRADPDPGQTFKITKSEFLHENYT
jgi:hypothetical protein